MKILPFNKPNSIWKTLNMFQKDGILDKEKVENILDPLDKGQIRISGAFLEDFYDEKQEDISYQIDAIIDLLNLIVKGNVSGVAIVQKKLKQLNICTASIIEDLSDTLTSENYNNNVYELFKKILFGTSDKEIFKLAIEITSYSLRCEELIERYLLIGQNEEFTRYIAYAFIKWLSNEKFKEAIFKLLDLSKDWGKVYLVEALLYEKEFLRNINIQRKILISALENNSLQMEIVITLGCSLDLDRLLELSNNDEELFKYLVILFNAIFFETTSHKGVWAVIGNNLNLLNNYIDKLRTTSFNLLKLLGIKGLREFIHTNEIENYIRTISQADIYDSLESKIEILWQQTYSIELIKRSIREELDIYGWCDFIKKYQVKELLEECKLLYNKENKFNWIIEDTLIVIGDMPTKVAIYEKLKELVDTPSRKKEDYSYINIWDDTYERENSIINKIKILERLPFEQVVEFNKKILTDYNPQVRSRAIGILRKRKESSIKADKNLVKVIIERLSDGPFYVRNEALELCMEKHITISRLQAKRIEVSWKIRDERNNEAFYKGFERIQDEI